MKKKVISDKIEILINWVQTGQVKTSKGRNHDDLLTLINQINIELSKRKRIRRKDFLTEIN